MFSKKSIVFFASSLTLFSLASARTEYNENGSVGSDINDNWVVVDYPKSAGSMSTTRGNVIVNVEENVSITADYLNVYGTGSSIKFLGNNQVNAGNISIFGGADKSKGASMEFYNSTVNTSQINLREDATSLILKDSQVTISGKLVVNTNSSIVIDGGSLTCDIFSQTGAYSKETKADIKIINGAALKLNGQGNGAYQNGYNIYVDSESSFNATAIANYYGKLTFEAGAEVSFAKGNKLENMSFELVIDDVSTLQEKELNEYFETITLAGNSIENLLTSENLTVLDKMSGISFEVSVSDSGIITLVPEPSTYAAIFGAVVLAFAAYRRRK